LSAARNFRANLHPRDGIPDKNFISRDDQRAKIFTRVYVRAASAGIFIQRENNRTMLEAFATKSTRGMSQPTLITQFTAESLSDGPDRELHRSNFILAGVEYCQILRPFPSINPELIPSPPGAWQCFIGR